MRNSKASCAIRKALLSIEQSLRLTAKGSHDISTRVILGVISLEVQKQRVVLEYKCFLCLRSEAA
jgi:hypothetical protein